MRHRTYRNVVVLVAAVALTATSCAGDGSSDGDGSKVDFVWAGPALPDTADPLEAGPLAAVLSVERLSRPVSFDVEDLKGKGCKELATIDDIKGELAESWKFSKDRKTLTLKFREGVKSPFGNELTSKDVKWSMDRGIALSSTIDNLLSNVSKWRKKDPVEIAGKYSVKIHIAEPGSMDLAVLTLFRWMIHDSTEAKKHATKADPWAKKFLEKNSANFGPWHFTEDDWDPGKQVTMKRNPNYYAPEEFGNVGRLVMRVIPEASTRAQLVTAGEIDYAGQLAPTDYAQLDKDDGSAQVLDCVAGDRDNLVLNHADKRFKDVRVRKAMSLAIDRKEVAKAAYAGYALPATDGMHQNYEFQKPEDGKRYEYAPDRARKLLAEAGYPNGFKATLALSPGRPGPQAEQLGINVQSQLKRIGIDLKIRVVGSPSEFQTMFLKGRYQAVIYQEPPAIPDPAYAAGLYNVCGGYQNSFGYCNREYDRIQQAIQDTSPGKLRSQRVSELSALIVETVPVVYLLDTKLQRAFSANVDVSTYEHHPYSTTVEVHKLTKRAA